MFELDAEITNKPKGPAFEVDLDDYVEVVKRCRCKTSPNGNYQLYNVFSGEIYFYEWNRRKFPYIYRVYRKYDPLDESKCVYVDLEPDAFGIYFKPIN